MKMVFVLISGPAGVGEAVVVADELEVEAGVVGGLEVEAGVDGGPEVETGVEGGLDVEAGVAGVSEDEAWVISSVEDGAGDENGTLDVDEAEVIRMAVSPDVVEVLINTGASDVDEGHFSVYLYSPSRLKHQTESSFSFS